MRETKCASSCNNSVSDSLTFNIKNVCLQVINNDVFVFFYLLPVVRLWENSSCFLFGKPQGVRASAGVCYQKEGKDKSKDGGSRKSGAVVLLFCSD